MKPMSKKDYELIAAALRRMHPDNSEMHGAQKGGAYREWLAIVVELDEMFWRNNFSFNRAKFREACGG